MERHLIGQRYQLEEKIGSGAAGDVFRGADTISGRPAAIKALKPEIVESDPEFLVRFQREGQVLRQLDHPNIVSLLDVVEEDGRHYLILEFVPGGDLAGLIKASPGGLPIEQILPIALKLADALTRAHQLEVIHRDLKPANVLLDQDGTPLLTDFGFAHLAGVDSLTQSGALIGTLHYLSPEACQGEKLDPRADIWSLGVILFELLTGHRPFQGDAPWQVLMAIMQEPVPDLFAARPDVPDDLVDLVLRTLVKDRGGRLPSAQLVGAELEAIIQGGQFLPGWEPSDIFQIETASLVKSELPAPATPFVGREDELLAIEHLLADDGGRLLTLHGPGGIGKSRLALEYAWRQSGDYPDQTFFVSLVPLSSAEQLVPAIAEAIGLGFKGDLEPRRQLMRYLKGRQMLLVLDNFEHLLDEASLVKEIVETAPRLKCVVTSREWLGLAAESVYEVSGLDTPEVGAGPDELAATDAVRMFVTYARRAQPDYELSEAAQQAVADICRLVGGMPLAIELAAAWVRVLSPSEILAELENDLAVLESRDPSVPPRQRSMQASFDYSWRQLTEVEQTALMKLAVFRGGFNRDAARAVAGTTIWTLAALVDKSMLRRNPASGRYQIHELIRQLAEARLGASGLAADTYRVHADYFLDLVETAATSVVAGQGQLTFRELARLELDNCRAAMDRMVAADGGPIALRFALALAYQLPWPEMVRRLEEALAASRDKAPPARRARAYLVITQKMFQEDMQLVQRHGEWLEMAAEALSIFAESGDELGVADALANLGFAHVGKDYARSRQYYRRALAAYERVGHEPAGELLMYGMLEMLEGNFNDARAIFDEATAIARQNDNRQLIMIINSQVATIEYFEGDAAKAESIAKQVLEYGNSQGRRSIAGDFIALGTLLDIALDNGNLEKARWLIRERLLFINQGEHYSLGIFFFHQIARWLLLKGDPVQAAFWIGSFELARHRHGQPLEKIRHVDYGQLVTAIREAQGEESYKSAYQDGYALLPEEAIELGLRRLG